MNEEAKEHELTKSRIRGIAAALCFAIGAAALAVVMDGLYWRCFGTSAAEATNDVTKGDWGGAIGTAVGKNVNERLLLASGPVSIAAFGLSMLLYNWGRVRKPREALKGK